MPFQSIPENTLLAVVQNVAGLLSLPKPVDPAGSTDPAVVLMVQSANLAISEMLNSYEWPSLTREGEIVVSTIVPPIPGESQTAAFALPDDFFRFLDQTQWNNSMRFPAVGPVSPQAWMTYRVFPITANFTLTWQMREGQIWFLNPPPPPGQAFRFMYLCRSMVIDADNASVTKNQATKNGDKFVLDPLLITLLARVKWLEAKGFDTTAATRDLIMMWDSRVGADKGASILNMAGRFGYPYLSIGNLPESSLYGMR